MWCWYHKVASCLLNSKCMSMYSETKWTGCCNIFFAECIRNNIQKISFEVVLNFFSLFRSYYIDFIRAIRLNWNATSLFNSKYVSSARHLLPALKLTSIFEEGQITFMFYTLQIFRCSSISPITCQTWRIWILIVRSNKWRCRFSLKPISQS